jgi:hypothetical protein
LAIFSTFSEREFESGQACKQFPFTAARSKQKLKVKLLNASSIQTKSGNSQLSSRIIGKVYAARKKIAEKNFF